MFLNQLFRPNFPRVNNIANGPFRATYHCYSVAFLPEDTRSRLNVDNGGKILLPQAALEQLVEQVREITFA